MYLKNLKLSNFKSYTEADIDFSPNMNCIVGDNGVGKTNLLDAVYYLSFCKSYFNPLDVQNIRHGEDYFAIHGLYDGDMQISCILKKGSPKQMRCNKKAYHTLAEHIGKIPLVLVSPYDQNLISEGSEVRRKFVDGILSQTDKGYLQHLISYQKALDQRNRLLKKFYEDGCFDEQSLSIWDEQLVRHGVPLVQGRSRFLNDFRPLLEEYHHHIVPEGDLPEMIYDSALAADGGDFADRLMQARQRDKYAQYTTVGPHKDDWQLMLGGYAVKRYGSQGQQKTFVLALKLAQFEYICRACGVKPILLLDDIFDKLDMPRVRQLMKLAASDHFGQVLLTDTQMGRVEAIFKEMPDVEHKIIHI